MTDLNPQSTPMPLAAAPAPLVPAPAPLAAPPAAVVPALAVTVEAPSPVVPLLASPAPAPSPAPESALAPAPTQEPADLAPVPEAVEDRPATEDESDTTEQPTPNRRGATSQAARDRQTVRRTVAKLVELSTADRDQVALAASLIGASGRDIPELTVAIMTASAKDLQPVNDARSIIGADQFEAGVVATALGRQRLRQVWKLFVALDVVTGDAPVSEPKAAIGIVRGLTATDKGDVLNEIEQAFRLLKR